jgi:hypothetical protein
MEAANVVLVPAMVLFLVWVYEGTPTLALAAAIIANMALLVIGACYWRIVCCALKATCVRSTVGCRASPQPSPTHSRSPC